MSRECKKDVPLVKQDVMKLEVFILDKELIRRERRDRGEGEERGLRKGREYRDREKRDKRELS